MSKTKIKKPYYFHDPIEGLPVAQSKLIDESFQELRDTWGDPEIVIEIGTMGGGFSVFLAQMFPDSEVHTFDPVLWGDTSDLKRREETFSRYGIHYHNEDCFARDGAKIRSMLDGKVLLLCDGAHKKNEFAHFSQFIKPGSVIMVHDYGRDVEYFKKNIEGIYWTSSMEFDGSEFVIWCREKNLEPFLQDLFEKSIWFIRKKF